MDKLSALETLNALAHETRLDVFRLLVQAGPTGLPAGEVATRLEVRQNTMSTHLAILTRAGMTTKLRDGRVIYYRANYQHMQELLLYLMQDCCGGKAEICTPMAAALAKASC